MVRCIVHKNIFQERECCSNVRRKLKSCSVWSFLYRESRPIVKGLGLAENCRDGREIGGWLTDRVREKAPTKRRHMADSELHL